MDEAPLPNILTPKEKITESFVINQEENIAIVANNIGIIYAYEVKDNTFILIKKVQYHQKSINYLLKDLYQRKENFQK